MNYTIATLDTMTGFTIELDANGKYRYIIITNKANGKDFISQNIERDKAEDLYWKLARLMTDGMYGWSNYVEMLEEAA